MAIITNYADLQTAIADYLARDDLTTWLPNFVQNAENKLYRRLNLRNEETSLSLDVSSGVATVPTDFKELKFAYYLNGSTAVPLQWMTLDGLYKEFPTRSGSTAQPEAIAREAGNFIFGPIAADGTGVLRGVYYAKQDPLRTTSPSWYSTNAPDALLWGSLLEAYAFIRLDLADQKWAIATTAYNDAVLSVEEENMNAEYTAGTIQQRAG